nr:ceramide synthase 5-like [Misgurnus anguillicaudatus]
MAALSAWFWNERFWLPHNVTWADLADPAPGLEYPKAGHLITALPLALGIFAVRIFFESRRRFNGEERRRFSGDRDAIVALYQSVAVIFLHITNTSASHHPRINKQSTCMCS